MAATPQGNTVQVVLTMDGASYSAALDKAQRQLDQFKGKATATGKAVGNALGGEDVREKIHLLAETIGVRLPRSLQSVIAKSEAAKMAVGALGGAIVGIGAIEFGGKAIIDAIDGVKKFYDRLRDLPKAIDEGFKPLINDARESATALDVQTDKINIAIAKIEKRPTNGIKLALDESYLSAEKLSTKLDTVIAQMNDVLSKNSVGFWDQSFSGKANTQSTQNLLGGWTKAIQDATDKLRDDTHNKASKDTIDQDTDLIRMKERQASEAAYNENKLNQQGKFTGAGGRVYQANNPSDIAAQQAMTANARDMWGAQADQGNSEKSNQSAQARLEAEQTKKDAQDQAKQAAEKAANDRMRTFQDELAQMKQNGSLSAKAEFDYWSQRISAFKSGSSQYLDVQKQMASIASEGAKAAHEALTKGMKDVSGNAALDPKEAQNGMDAFNKLMREQAEDVSMTGIRWREYNAELAKAAELQVKQAGAMQSLQVQHAVQTGTLSKEGAAQQMAGIHQADSEAEIRILQDKLAELQSDLKNLDPNSKDYETQLPQVTSQVAAAMAAIQSAQGSASQQAMQDQFNISDNSVWGQLKNSLAEFADQVTNVGNVLGQLATHSLSTINNAILNPGKAGSHPWSNAAASIGKSAESSALQYGEGTEQLASALMLQAPTTWR
jgi:hypothetical protein